MIFLTSSRLIENDWVTVAFIIVFLLLGIVKLLYKERLIKLVSLFFSKKYLLNYGKESQLVINWFNTALFIVQIIIFSLFWVAYFVLYKSDIVIDNSLEIFIKACLSLTVFFFFRYLIGKLLGVLFGIKQQQESLTFAKMSYLYNISLLVLPFLLFIFYEKTYNLLAFQLLIVVFAILLIVRYVVIVQNNKKIVFRNLFYFILYLCALEIAPVLLIFKIFV